MDYRPTLARLKERISHLSFKKDRLTALVSNNLLDARELLELRKMAEELSTGNTLQPDVDQKLLGDSQSVYRGHGIDYDESRAYFPGDELRFMNWRLTARTGEPHIKVFREERKPATVIVVDRRMSMRFGTRRRLKVGQAARAAALLAFSSHYRNEPVAGVLINSSDKPGLEWIDESVGEQGLYRFINIISAACPPLSPGNHAANNEQTSSEPDLAHLLKVLARSLKKGSRVILLSDFQDLDDNCRAALVELTMKHSLRAIQVVDPAEIHIPRCGQLLVMSVDGSISRFDSMNLELTDRFEQQSLDLVNSRQELLRSLAVPCDVLMTDDDRLDSILAGQAIG
jgi:uncharacterized protein (DUF58 family)